MEELIGELGRVPYQRTTVYGEAPAERVAASFRAAPLAATVNPPPRRHERARDRAAGALRVALVAPEHPAVTLAAVPGIPAIRPGDDLARILGDALEAAALRPPPRRRAGGHPQDRLQGRGPLRRLADVTPSPRARELAAATGKDPRLVEVILSESREVLRFRPGLIIAEHRLGMVIANAGSRSVQRTP